MIRQILGILLFHANHSSYYKEQFYAIKKKILSRWGTVVNYDLQHIDGVKCNRCNKGMHYHWISDMHKFGWEPCWHCNGSSWYKRERWIMLRKYKLGKYFFHIPINTGYGQWKGVMPITFRGKIIEGYISHSCSPFHLDHEAALWLFLLFDRRTFKEFIMWRIGYPYNAFTPLVMFQNYRYELWQLNK